jgi:hypothetical protein
VELTSDPIDQHDCTNGDFDLSSHLTMRPCHTYGNHRLKRETSNAEIGGPLRRKVHGEKVEGAEGDCQARTLFSDIVIPEKRSSLAGGGFRQGFGGLLGVRDDPTVGGAAANLVDADDLAAARPGRIRACKLNHGFPSRAFCPSAPEHAVADAPKQIRTPKSHGR